MKESDVAGGVTNAGDRVRIFDTTLRDGHLGGAIIDVSYPEPPPTDWPYWDTPNLIITPHVLSDDIDEYVPRTLNIFFENLRRHMKGEPLTNVVDLDRQY